MIDEEIATTQWLEACESFSHQHHGWLVTIRVTDTGQLKKNRGSAMEQARILISDQPLQDIREIRKDDSIEVLVTVGEGSDQRSFRVKDVIRLFSQKLNDAHKGLRIDSRNTTTTLVQFRVSAEPETLDGLAESEL